MRAPANLAMTEAPHSDAIPNVAPTNAVVAAIRAGLDTPGVRMPFPDAAMVPTVMAKPNTIAGVADSHGNRDT